ncbi:hypothetical protein [Minwuia sp.]|uniref:hypothetical protein n=1 Tax=Minwuia sp. TaxID=2493630 RepID=UPI003A8FD0D8
MEEIQGAAKFGALDLMLLGVFFISYNVLALLQIAFLYGGRYVTFGAVTVGAVLLAQGFVFLDVSAFCADRSSVIICSDDKRQLVSLGMVWVIVCAAMLVIFAALQGLRRLRAAK